MKSIEIKELSEEFLNELDETIYLKHNGEDKFVLMDIDKYELLNDIANKEMGEFDLTSINEVKPGGVKIITNEDLSLSLEDYEAMRKQLLDAFDATFKPKFEKMN